MAKQNQWKPTQQTIRDPKYKWKFALGTTSRVPNSQLHYLILDIDTRTSKAIAGLFISLLGVKHYFVQETENGLHVYTDKKIRFDQFEINARAAGADPSWIRIGLKRRYWFLADKDPIILPWSVERMVLHYDPSKERKKDS